MPARRKTPDERLARLEQSVADRERCTLCGGRPHARVINRWDMRLPLATPSQNEVGGNPRRGLEHERYKKLRDDACILFIIAKRELGIPEALVRRRAVFQRLYDPRIVGPRNDRYDHFNGIGGLKAVVDAMKIERLIVDDRDDWLEPHVLPQRRDTTFALLVRLEEVE